MLSAVESASAGSGAFKDASPRFHSHGSILCTMGLTAASLDLSIAAHDVFFHVSTIASRGDAHLARTTRAFVAWKGAVMLPTRHKMTAGVAAAPTVFVVRIDAAPCERFPAAKTELGRARLGAWGTRAGVAGGRTRVRTLLWQYPWSSTTARQYRSRKRQLYPDSVLACGRAYQVCPQEKGGSPGRDRGSSSFSHQHENDLGSSSLGRLQPGHRHCRGGGNSPSGAC